MKAINSKEWRIVFNGNDDDSCVVEACEYSYWLYTHGAIKRAVEAKVGQCMYDTWEAYCLETGDHETGSEI